MNTPCAFQRRSDWVGRLPGAHPMGDNSEAGASPRWPLCGFEGRRRALVSQTFGGPGLRERIIRLGEVARVFGLVLERPPLRGHEPPDEHQEEDDAEDDQNGGKGGHGALQAS